MQWILLALVLVVAAFLLVYVSMDRINNFARDCAIAEGHLYGSGLTLCLTDDGRIIEVYP